MGYFRCISVEKPLEKSISESQPINNRNTRTESCSQDFESLRKFAVIVAAVSVVANVMLATYSFVCAILKNSASTSAFANRVMKWVLSPKADCALDVLSSVIVFWRYYGADNLSATYAKEQAACLYLGVMFIASGIAVIVKAVVDLIQETEALPTQLMLYLSICGAVIWFALFVAKLILYRKMKSDSMLLDAINSCVSAVFAVVFIIFSTLLNFYGVIPFLDPVISILVALFMVVYGIRVLKDSFQMPSADGYIAVP